MFIAVKTLSTLFLLSCLTATVLSDEKIEPSSRNSQIAVEKLKAAPSAVGKTLQDLGKAVGAKFVVGPGEVKAAKATSEKAPATDAETNAENPQPLPAQIIGKRDPFRPFTLNNRPSRRQRVNLSPLERYELGQLKLVGVVWDINEPNAVVEDSAGLGYMVKVGTLIGSNEGKVRSIHPEKIVIEEFEFDVFGAKKKIERSMRLAPERAE